MFCEGAEVVVAAELKVGAVDFEAGGEAAVDAYVEIFGVYLAQGAKLGGEDDSGEDVGVRVECVNGDVSPAFFLTVFAFDYFNVQV